MPCGASASLRSTRKLSPMGASATLRDALMDGGDARAKREMVTEAMQADFQRTYGSQHIEGGKIAHVSDAHELALHLILAALHGDAEFIAHQAHKFAAVEAVGGEDAGNAGGGRG